MRNHQCLVCILVQSQGTKKLQEDMTFSEVTHEELRAPCDVFMTLRSAEVKDHHSPNTNC